MMKERIEKAEKQLQRVQAISDVYDLILAQYNIEYCIHCKDEEGNYMYEGSTPIYEEKSDNPEDFCGYPWYDGERALRSREVFREVLQMIEKMN